MDRLSCYYIKYYNSYYVTTNNIVFFLSNKVEYILERVWILNCQSLETLFYLFKVEKVQF